MAKHPTTGHPTLNKTPFGGVPGKSTSDNALLPGRHALSLLIKGNPSQRGIADFGQRTPVGSGAPNDGLDILKKGF